MGNRCKYVKGVCCGEEYGEREGKNKSVGCRHCSCQEYNFSLEVNSGREGHICGDGNESEKSELRSERNGSFGEEDTTGVGRLVGDISESKEGR